MRLKLTKKEKKKSSIGSMVRNQLIFTKKLVQILVLRKNDGVKIINIKFGILIKP